MFLDTELIRILTDIQTHDFHQYMMSYDYNMILTAKHRRDDLQVYKDSIKKQLQLIY